MQHPSWQRGYDDAQRYPGKLEPGQSVRGYIDSQIAYYERFTHPEYWSNAHPEFIEGRVAWHCGFIAGIKAQWSAALKTEELYGRE